MRFVENTKQKQCKNIGKIFPFNDSIRTSYLTIFLLTESLRFSKAELLRLAESLHFAKRKRGVFFMPCRIVGFYHENRRTEKPVA